MSGPALAQPTHEVDGSRHGSGDISSGDSFEERKYKVYFVNATANSIDARNAVGVPAWGAALTDGVITYSLYVITKSAEPESGNQTIWIVTVTYRTLAAFTQQPNFDSADKWNIVKSITPFPYEVPIQKDRDGKIAVNVLSEPIKPPLTKVKCDFQINISYLTDALDPDPILACLENVNDGTVSITIGGVLWVFAANTLLLQTAPIQETFDSDGNPAAQVSLQLMYRIDGWTAKIPNLSYNQASTVSGMTLTPILDSNNQPVGEPRYLDGSGHPLADGASIVTKDFEPADTADFTDLLDGIV